VLVVEDDAETRDALVALLRAAGLAVVASDEGRKALEVAQVLVPAVVVLDLAMPGVGGVEFLARRRDVGALREVPVIVVSGNAVGEDVDADAVFPKPVDGRALVAAVARLARHAVDA
jgi:CheY-like chemotaxis protein